MITIRTSPGKDTQLAILIFALINSFFLLSMPLLPFIDLPNHLAEAAIFKYYGQPGNILSDYYKPAPWYFPNTFHTLFCSVFPSVEMGNKLFHIFYVVLLPVSVFFAIRQLNGNLWYGLLAILFTFGYNLSFGFV